MSVKRWDLDNEVDNGEAPRFVVGASDFDAKERELAACQSQAGPCIKDAERYRFLKRAPVLTIDWIIGLPDVEWDAEIDKCLGREQFDAARGGGK